MLFCLLLPLFGLCVKFNYPVFSAVFLFRVYLVPLTVQYYLVLFCCFFYLASCPFIAGRSFIAIVYSCVSPVYVALDF